MYIDAPKDRRGDMELSVAANYDCSLVPQLATYPVTDMYGKLPQDLAGGGRASFSATPLSFSHLREYVAELKAHQIAFTYLLNSACIGNREWDRRWQRRLFRFLEKLQTAGITRLTVSTPLLFKIIKKTFPECYLKVGIFAQVDTLSRARYWQDLGADEITLESFSINRDFHTLKAIRKGVSCALQLIVNHPCLPNCPMQPYHQNGLSHASDGSGRLFIDYCFLMCSQARLQTPSLLIKSQWIRPEDLSRYESLGFNRFKLLERNIPSAQLLKRVQAYSERRSCPNFADLILPYGFPEKPENRWRWLIRYFFRPFQIRPGKLIPFYELIKKQGMLFPLAEQKIYIDSARIPADFLDLFEHIDCTLTDCQTCGYCNHIANTALRIDPAFQQDMLSRYKQLDKDMTTGKLWNV
jgi:hypothetical protein